MSFESCHAEGLTYYADNVRKLTTWIHPKFGTDVIFHGDTVRAAPTYDMLYAPDATTLKHAHVLGNPTYDSLSSIERRSSNDSAPSGSLRNRNDQLLSSIRQIQAKAKAQQP